MRVPRWPALLSLAAALCLAPVLHAAPRDSLPPAPDWLSGAEQAAESGDPRAAFLLGLYFELREETDNAYRWYLAAAEHGLPRAQVRIGEFHQNGEGRPRDLAEALAWYRRAAESGSPQGMDYLGIFLAEGYGIDRDCAGAVHWFENAMRAGYTPARNNLAYTLSTCPDPAVRDGQRAVELARDLDPEDIASLDTLAAAHAEAGDFERAVQIQQQVVNKASAAGNADDVSRFNAKLESYRNERPWREDGKGYKEFIFENPPPELPVPGTRI